MRILLVLSLLFLSSIARAYTATDESSLALKLPPGFQQQGETQKTTSTMTTIYVHTLPQGGNEKIRMDSFKKPPNMTTDDILKKLYDEFILGFKAGMPENMKNIKYEITPLTVLPQKNVPFSAWLVKTSIINPPINVLMLWIDADASTLYVITYFPEITDGLDVAIAKLKSFVDICYKSGCYSVQ